ncbi:MULTISPECIES: hypothetical protein [unclassified Mesorhizobium]|uniref:hypothetical protein n=1 Tax=unclassified Mesorhizobium TaxID=325217 RepID=UPI00112D4091|nr:MULTISPECIES: hypothetical protein [unclassified Mesorhizobium]MBZ9999629.1 hypothetical protein [Mesorhizobium sp. B264B2A]MCA0008103.1 hypothetical protein [Mesorhizobium sp. B264B1B]MCA0018023.1 hypothetical protein [Mesorhizobium sp. B264B1A]TPJ37860.1 hypothetical protein FJ437_31520 [Mesorhizobium sp. B2-6-6]
MPRRKRHETISSYHLGLVERQAWLLTKELREAQLALKPFTPHWEAIDQLHQDMRRALNLLNDRPADYERPHMAPMSGGGPP